MDTLQYTVIKTKKQYYEYCDRHEALAFSGDNSKVVQDEMELLDVLIEKWDAGYNNLRKDVDPITLLKYIMDEHKMQPKDLAALLGVGKSLVSEILNYKKGLSKDAIRILAKRFKLQQEALNQPYEMKGAKPAVAEVKVGKPITASSKATIATSTVKTNVGRTAHR